MTKGIQKKDRKKIVVAVSGGFDPLHEGHVRMFQEARALGDELVVIINNDHWLRKKKGYVFMAQRERKAIISSIRFVDRVVLTKHPRNPVDMSVCRELAILRPDIFANGGDRTRKNIPEVPLCKKIGCRIVFTVGYGGKIQSSSWLVQQCMQVLPCHCGARKVDGAPKLYKHCHGKEIHFR